MPPSPSSYRTDIKEAWLKAINAGVRAKELHYLPEANMCEEYYGSDQKNIYTQSFTDSLGLFPQSESLKDTQGIDGNSPRAPRFRVRDNAAAKAVQIFVPMFLQGEMATTVKPNKPFFPPPQTFGVQGDPNQPQPVPPPNSPPQAMQQYVQQEMARQQYFMAAQQSQAEMVDREYRASILEAYINYVVKESDLKKEARPALRDTIVRGLGALITEQTTMPDNTGSLIVNTYLDDDRIIIDPDAKRLSECKWVAVLCEHPIWEAAAMYKQYGVTEQDLKPSGLSKVGDATTSHQMPFDSTRRNLFRYWKIFSRCGIGARLLPQQERNPLMQQIDQTIGDFCYIVVGEGCDFPLNLTPAVEDMCLQAGTIAPLQVVTSWPVPFYYDKDDPWPFTSCWFHERKGQPWPKAHLSFALGYLNFMAWILGFVAEKAYRDSRGVWVIDSSVTEVLTNWLENGQDEEILKITKGMDGKGKISDMVEFLKGPEFDGTLITLYQFMKAEYQDMTGITDLLQGQMDRQMRSAEEANVLQSASQLRPQDMANEVKAWLARVLRKTAIAARYLQSGKDLVSVLGQYGAMAWDNGIRTRNMADLFRESTFNVETGKGRPQDINTDLENINQAMQFMLPAMDRAYQMSGDPSGFNGLVELWGEARQMDTAKMMLKPFAPPPLPGTPEHEAQTREVEGQKKKEKEAEKAKKKT